MVIELESGFLTSVFLVELQFNTFPSIVKLIPLPLYVEEIKMFVVPCSMFATVTLGVLCLLEFEHVQGSFGPLAARNRKFSAKVVSELLDVENVNTL